MLFVTQLCIGRGLVKEDKFSWWVRQYSSMEIYHEIFSAVIISLLLLQEGQLSISGKRICTGTVNCLEDEACPGKVCK